MKRLLLGLLAFFTLPASADPLKISNMTSGGVAQAADEFPIARSGSNYKVTGEGIGEYVDDGHKNVRVGFFDELANANLTQCYAIASGTGAASSNVNGESGHIGVLETTTGTSTTGSTAIWCMDDTAIQLGGGVAVFESIIKIPTASDGSNTYRFIAGWIDESLGADQTDAVAFVYDSAGTFTNCTGSVNWQKYTANNGTRTCAATTTAVSTAAWLRLRIECDATASSCTWFVNGTSIGSQTTNIPTGAGRTVGVMLVIKKTAGTTERVFQSDYVKMWIDLTSAR